MNVIYLNEQVEIMGLLFDVLFMKYAGYTLRITEEKKERYGAGR